MTQIVLTEYTSFTSRLLMAFLVAGLLIANNAIPERD